MRISLSSVSRLASLQSLLAVIAATLVLGLSRLAAADFTPGRTFPKDGVAPNPKVIVEVLYWYHKKHVEEFGFQDYYQAGDDVYGNKIEYIRKAMAKHYPNLVVLTLQTNEAEVKAKVEQVKKEKRVPLDYVDVPQPAKIGPPEKVRRRDYSYDGGATIIGPEIVSTKAPPEFAVVDKVTNTGVILKVVRTHELTRIVTVTVLRGGKKVVETRNVPFQTYSDEETAFPLKDDAGFDTTGKKLTKAEILARLKPGQTVILARDANGIDPAYLTILKPETIILRNGPGK